MAEASLTRSRGESDLRGLVLLLHGGQEHSADPVLRRHGSWSRMSLMARDLGRPARRQRVAVWLLRNRVRGWNARAGSLPDPVTDARWAMARVRAECPGAPVVLVGHSMGGRTACAIADEQGVVGVVALAPWLPPGEPVDAVAATPLIVVHGTADHWTRPADSSSFVDRVRAAGGSAAWLPIEGAGHTMLGQLPTWRRRVRGAALGLVGVEDLPPDLVRQLGQTAAS